MSKLAVGKQIRQARERKGWSRATLGRIMGIHPKTIENWEYGRFNPNPIYRQLIARVLELDLSQDTDPPKAVTFDITIDIEGGNGEKPDATK